MRCISPENNKYIYHFMLHYPFYGSQKLQVSKKVIACRNEAIRDSVVMLHTDKDTCQARVQEFVRGGGAKSESLFFCFSIFRGGGAAQKIAEKMIFSTKNVAKYRGNSLTFALMTFFLFFCFCFSISRGGGAGPLAPPWTRACMLILFNLTAKLLRIIDVQFEIHS